MSLSCFLSRQLAACGRCRPSALVAAFSLALSANVFAHGVTLKMQLTQPADAAFTKQFVEPWANKINDQSRGRINLLMTSSPGASTDLFQAVRERNADIVWLELTQPANAFPRFAVFGLALQGTSSQGSSQALWSWIDLNDLGFREFKEMRILAAARHDAPVFHMREKPLSSLADLDGASIAIPSPAATDFLASLGAKPVVVRKAAMANALAEAQVDGVLLSWSSMAELGLEQQVKTHAAAPHGAAWPYAELSVLLMNPDAYRSLADDLKQVIRNSSGIDTSAWIGSVFDDNAALARQRAIDRGDTVTTLPAAELSTWQTAARSALDKRIDDLDARGLKGESIVSRASALIKQYDSAN